MEFGAGTEQIQRITTLVPTYVAPEARWQETTADPVDDTAAITRWGEGQPRQVDLLAVQHHGQAAHLCRQQLAKMNPRRRMTLKLRSFGLRLIGERAVYVSVRRTDFQPLPFWIDSFQFDGTNVTVDLVQADPASFTDLTVAEEGTAPQFAADVDRGSSGSSVTIGAVAVVTSEGPPYIRVTGGAILAPGERVTGQYRRSGTDQVWTQMIPDAAGAGYSLRTQPLGDQSEYDVRVFATYTVLSASPIQRSPMVTAENINVIADGTAPDAPVIFSSTGSAGGTLNVIFRPDLGANYYRTGLYRAGPTQLFTSATLVQWSYATSSEVAMADAIPAAGARYWLQSENSSGVKSAQVLVGTYS